ncbi:MAG TPA: helix-turn-helix transcriptional regulator [Thermoanaerobaculia bacterium]
MLDTVCGVRDIVHDLAEAIHVSHGHMKWRDRYRTRHSRSLRGSAEATHVSHGYTNVIADRANTIYAVFMPRRRTPDRDAKAFGAVIRRLREARGWTLIDFGRKANMNPTYLGFLERGENVPTLAAVLRLAKVLGVEAADVIREIEGQQK